MNFLIERYSFILGQLGREDMMRDSQHHFFLLRLRGWAFPIHWETVERLTALFLIEEQRKNEQTFSLVDSL